MCSFISTCLKFLYIIVPFLDTSAYFKREESKRPKRSPNVFLVLQLLADSHQVLAQSYLRKVGGAYHIGLNAATKTLSFIGVSIVMSIEIYMQLPQ